MVRSVVTWTVESRSASDVGRSSMTLSVVSSIPSAGCRSAVPSVTTTRFHRGRSLVALEGFECGGHRRFVHGQLDRGRRSVKNEPNHSKGRCHSGAVEPTSMTTLVVASASRPRPSSPACSSRVTSPASITTSVSGSWVAGSSTVASSCAASMPPTGSPARSVLRATVSRPSRVSIAEARDDQQHLRRPDRQCDASRFGQRLGRVRCTRTPRFVRWGCGTESPPLPTAGEVAVTGISDTVVPGTPGTIGVVPGRVVLWVRCVHASGLPRGPATVVHDGIHRGAAGPGRMGLRKATAAVCWVSGAPPWWTRAGRAQIRTTASAVARYPSGRRSRSPPSGYRGSLPEPWPAA